MVYRWYIYSILSLRGFITQLETEGAPPCGSWKNAGFQSVFVGVSHVPMHEKDMLQLKVVVLVPNLLVLGHGKWNVETDTGTLKQQMDKTAKKNIK